ncbi:hypothetical protein AB0B85_32845 [Micromonospora sp. NPDC049044]|uniref:hypothetical protein n=1 Tax=Micromonospora sp. NPDC049044 TaxID=3154827 RepID=UPI0033D815BF
MSMSSVLRGKQEPRVGNFPPGETGAGEDAIEFAADLGIGLYDWQKYAIRNGLREVADPQNPDLNVWAASDVGLMVPRQNGKSYIIDVLILAGLFLFDERIILTAQKKKPNAEKIFFRVANIIEKWVKAEEEERDNPGLQKLLLPGKTWLSKENGGEFIRLESGAFLEMAARGKNARGDSIDKLIHDEAYDLTEVDEAALSFALSGSRNPQTWYLSTPPLDTSSGEPYSNIRERGLANDEDVCWMEWSVDPNKSLEDVLDDREAWAQANPAMNLHIRESTIRKERAKATKNKKVESFARERLGRWPLKQSNNLISTEAWEAIADPESQPADGSKFAIGACAWQVKNKVHAAVALYGVRKDGKEHLEIIRTDPGVDWVPAYLAELKEKYAGAENPELIAIGIDPQSPLKAAAFKFAPSGITIPEDADEPEFGDLAVMTGADYLAGCSQFVTAVEDKTFHHRKFAPLDLAVAGAHTRMTQSGIWVFDRARSDVDTSPLTAGVVARWAYVTRKDSVGSGDYDLMDSFG